MTRLALAIVTCTGLFAGPVRQGATRTVDIKDMAFKPASIEAQVGDTIVWTNRDMVEHSAAAVSAPTWSTGNIAPGKEGRYVVKSKGTIEYFCQLHPVMKGSISVK